MASLDFLRFVAAFAVMLYHFSLASGAPAAGWSPTAVVMKMCGYGYLGAHLFFFISGYVILMSAWGRDVIAFVASRVSRIYPAYIPAVLLAAVLAFLRPDYVGGLRLTSVIANLTMMNPLMGVPNLSGVYWTLWAELRFYVLIAVLLHFGLTKGRILVFALLWPFVGLLATQSGWLFLRELLLADWAPIFAAGMVLFLIMRDGWSLGAGLVMGLDVVLGSGKIYSDAVRLVGEHHPIRPQLAVMVYFLAFAAVALAASPVLRSLESQSLSWCGLLTYPLYLVHAAVGAFVFTVVGREAPWAGIAVASVVAVAVAIAFHYLFEKPWHRRVRIAVDRSLREFVAEPATRVDA